MLIRFRQLCHEQVLTLLGLHVIFTVWFFVDLFTHGQPFLFAPKLTVSVALWLIERVLIASYCGWVFTALLKFRHDMRRSELGYLWLWLIYGRGRRPLL